MVKLTDNSSFPALQHAVLRFWAWWRRELSATVAPLGRVLTRPRKGAVVRVYRSAEDAEDSGTATRTTLDDASWRELAARLKRRKRRPDALTLVLGPDLYLSRKASYPAGAVTQLDSIIDLDIAQSTPFTGETAVWKWRVTGRANGRIDVETAILRRDLVMSLLSLASQNGLEVAEIDIEGAGRPLRIMKLSTPADQARRRWRRINAALATALVLLAAGGAGALQWKREEALAAANARLEAVKVRAVRMRRAQADAIAEYDSNAALLREKARTPSVVTVWNALSQALPDTVWLSGLELTRDGGRISGFAASAAPLIEKLERLSGFSAVAFSSPVNINPDDRLERFEITFTLTAGERDLAAVLRPMRHE